MDGQEQYPGSMGGNAPWLYSQSYAGPASSERGTEAPGAVAVDHMSSHFFPGGPMERNPEGPVPSSPLHYQSYRGNHEYSETPRDPDQRSQLVHDYDPNNEDSAYQYSHPQNQLDGSNMYYSSNQHRPPAIEYASNPQPQHSHYGYKGPSPLTAYPPASQQPGPSVGPPMSQMNQPSYAHMSSHLTGRQPAHPQWDHHHGGPYQNMSYPSTSPFIQSYHQGFPTHPGAQHNSSGQQFSQSQYPPHYFHPASGYGYPQGPHSHSALPSSGNTTSSPSAVVKDQPKKKVKQRKFQRKVGKPKRPLSAYNLFFKDERAKMLAAQGTGEDEESEASSEDKKKAPSQENDRKKKRSGIGFAEMAQVISAQWKKIEGETLTKYKDKAAVDMQRYRKEMDEFNHKQQQQEKPDSEKRQEEDDDEDDEPS